MKALIVVCGVCMGDGEFREAPGAEPRRPGEWRCRQCAGNGTVRVPVPEDRSAAPGPTEPPASSG